MTGKVINYYAGGHTAKGYYDLFDSNLQNIEHIFLLLGGPDLEKTAMIKRIAETWQNKGYDLEIIHTSSNNESLDGLIIPALSCAVLDSAAPFHFHSKAPGALEQYVNLTEAWDQSLLETERHTILALQKERADILQTAYQSFEKGLRIHDDLEAIYINQMDFNRANEVTDNLIDEIFIGKQSETDQSVTKHRFFGASTPNGVVDFIVNLTNGLSKRYFIKGRAGTGKSTLLKSVAATAEERQFDVEIYHCGFDPDSLDMVIVRELGLCVFDSTDPHEYFPIRHGDEIIDLYEKAVTPGTDEKYEKEIHAVTKAYKQRMKEGIAYLHEAKILQDQLISIYTEATHFSVLEQISNQLNEAIESLAE